MTVAKDKTRLLISFRKDDAILIKEQSKLKNLTMSQYITEAVSMKYHWDSNKIKRQDLRSIPVLEIDVAHHGNFARWLNEFIEKYNRLVDYVCRNEVN